MTTPFVEHPDRRAADAEIHARPIAPIQAPARIRRVGFLFAQDHASARMARSRIEAFCSERGILVPALQARRLDFDTPTHQVTWEFHTEFATVTWASRFDDPDVWPSEIGLEAVDKLPVVVAVRVDIMATPAISAAALAGFDERSLCYASVDDGRAQVATDFLADRAGYTRYEVALGDLGSTVAGALTRRLLEIETYRVLALIGIGLGRSEIPRLSELEATLATTMDSIGAAPGPEGSAALLDSMYTLQLAASHSVERTRYRFAASRAYGEILVQRLRDLNERRHGEHWTLQGYLKQRIEPALATILALERRQTDLMEQAARSTALLGTRISLDIDTQNRSILTTISETSKNQFRLQRTVEGLSTIAITYYLLGIISHVVEGVAPASEHEKSIGIAIFAPLALVFVFFYLRRARKH